MLKIWWIWKIEIWSKELVDGHETVLYKPGALFLLGEGGGEGGEVNPLVVFTHFPTHFNRYTPFYTTSNFTFIHVYPCLNLHVREEISGYLVGIASHPR